MAITGESGNAILAAMANGIAVPMEPAVPLMSRCGAEMHAWNPLAELPPVRYEHRVRVATQRLLNGAGYLDGV